MGGKFTAKPRKIESSIDLPHHVIFGNRVSKMKLVEQLTLVTLQTAHHGSTSSGFASTQRNHASWPLSIGFCNKIGHFRTHAPQQNERYSITSSARESSAGGKSRPMVFAVF